MRLVLVMNLMSVLHARKAPKESQYQEFAHVKMIISKSHMLVNVLIRVLQYPRNYMVKTQQGNAYRLAHQDMHMMIYLGAGLIAQHILSEIV